MDVLLRAGIAHRARILLAMVGMLTLMLLLVPMAQAGPYIEFRNMTPADGAWVPAGTVSLSVDLIGSNIGPAVMLLNSEIVSVERQGTGQQVNIRTQRVLAPGDYTVRVFAFDTARGRQLSTWRFVVRLDDPIPSGFSQVDAKIEIVFPHEGAPVGRASQANTAAYLFAPGTLVPVPFDMDKPVRLWRALNNDPAQLVALGSKVPRAVEGRVFPAWELSDVDVSAVRDPRNKLYFFITVDGMGTNSNVWVHAADARTFFPYQDVPSGRGPWEAAIDAKVEIVFPHRANVPPDVIVQLGIPRNVNPLANIGVALFSHNSLRSVDESRDPFVILIPSVNADVSQPGELGGDSVWGLRIFEWAGGLRYPRWVFNDFDVTPAANPRSMILFRVAIEGVGSYTNVWAHGTNARTFFPTQDIPSRSAQGALAN